MLILIKSVLDYEFEGMRPEFRRLQNGVLILDYSEKARKIKAAYNKSRKEKAGGNSQTVLSLTSEEVSIQKFD